MARSPGYTDRRIERVWEARLRCGKGIAHAGESALREEWFEYPQANVTLAQAQRVELESKQGEMLKLSTGVHVASVGDRAAVARSSKGCDVHRKLVGGAAVALTL